MKKALSVIKKVFVSILATLAVCMAVFTIFSVFSFNKTDRNVLGYKFYIVLSDSMKATDFAAGDLVVSKQIDPAELVEGDIISFVSTDNTSYGEIVTHKIRKVNNNNGVLYFTTYGTTTDTDDRATVPSYNVLGKYKFSLPKVGYFFNFLKTTPGYICCIFVPFMLLIIVQLIDTISIFREYKREELAVISKEKDDIMAQKEKNEQMLREIEALKAQLNSQNNQTPQNPVNKE